MPRLLRADPKGTLAGCHQGAFVTRQVVTHCRPARGEIAVWVRTPARLPWACGETQTASGSPSLTRLSSVPNRPATAFSSTTGPNACVSPHVTRQ